MFYFTRDELNRLLLAAEASCPLHGLLLRTCYRHAFRIGEALQLTTANVKGDRLVVRRSKQGKITNQKMAEDLIAYVQTLKPGDRLFVFSQGKHPRSAYRKVDRILKALCAKAGIERHRAHTHSLRHSLVHHGRAAGMSYPQLTRILGHADPKSVMHYDIATEQEAEQALAAVVGG